MSSSSGRNNSSSSQQRVEPTFFPHLYHHGSNNSNNRKDDKSSVAPPPGTGNPAWIEDIPPPPYTQSPSEPTISSPHSEISADPSAPPLEEDVLRTYSPGNVGGFIRPQQPPQRSTYGHLYNNYGALPNNHTTGDANVPTWPWLAPPSASGQGYLIYPTPPNGEFQPPKPKQRKGFCEKLFQFLFYFFIVFILLRLFGLLHFSLGPDSCENGVRWGNIPETLNFDHSLIIRVASGHLTKGTIRLKSITDQSIEEEGITQGTVKIQTLKFPTSLKVTNDITEWSNGTVLELYIPEDSTIRTNCVRFDAVIYVPPNAQVISIEVQNSRIEVVDETLQIEDLLLQTSNNVINFYPEWSGKDLVLTTTNAHIELNRPVTVKDTIVLSTSNAGVRVRDNVKAGNYVHVSTTNGAVDFDRSVDTNLFQITTSSGKISVQNLNARAAQLRTTNGRIQVEHSTIQELLNIQTTNDPVYVRVDHGMENGELLARTTNAASSVILPWNHEGSFDLSTSSHSKVLLGDPFGWATFSASPGRLAGTRYMPENNKHVAKGHVQVVTSNGPASLEFAEP